MVIGRSGAPEAALRCAAGILSFGLCGGLDPALGVGDLVVGTGVVTKTARCFEADPVWAGKLAAALPGAVMASVAASNQIVASPAAKAELRDRTGAGCADMESHRVAALASKVGLPFAIVRAVSDPADRGLPRAAQAGFGDGGEADIGAVLVALTRHPLELFPLIRTALDASQAIGALERVATAVLAVRP